MKLEKYFDVFSPEVTRVRVYNFRHNRHKRNPDASVHYIIRSTLLITTPTPSLVKTSPKRNPVSSD